MQPQSVSLLAFQVFTKLSLKENNAHLFQEAASEQDPRVSLSVADMVAAAADAADGSPALSQGSFAEFPPYTAWSYMVSLTQLTVPVVFFTWLLEKEHAAKPRQACRLVKVGLLMLLQCGRGEGLAWALQRHCVGL